MSPVTVNAARYARMISDFVVPALDGHGELGRIVLQQDGAPPHTSASAKEILGRYFPGRVISQGFGVKWPPRSPDLSPADFWLWGYLKSRVYLQKPKNLTDLKNSISLEVRKLTSDQLAAAVASIPHRLAGIFQTGGGHVECL